MKSFFKNLFKKKHYTPNYFDYSAKDKKKIIKQAAALACKEQLDLVGEHNKKYGYSHI